jgi:hypothetical protein
MAQRVAAKIQSLAESIARARIKAENYALAASAGTPREPLFSGGFRRPESPHFFWRYGASDGVYSQFQTCGLLWITAPVSGSGVPK